MDRRAFRLCINSDDCENLLDETKWPAHVYVSEWYFRSASTHRVSVAESSSLKPNQDNTQRIINLARSVEELKSVNIYQVLNQVDARENESMVDDDATIIENTIILEDGGSK
jgi:hypothetical protein